jgi:hypothetical protein
VWSVTTEVINVTTPTSGWTIQDAIDWVRTRNVAHQLHSTVEIGSGWSYDTIMSLANYSLYNPAAPPTGNAIIPNSEKVYNATYTAVSGTDYTIYYNNATIVFHSTGNLIPSSRYTVEFEYNSSHGGIVELTSGTFSVSCPPAPHPCDFSPIWINGVNITLRGAGLHSTVINATEDIINNSVVLISPVADLGHRFYVYVDIEGKPTLNLWETGMPFLGSSLMDVTVNAYSGNAYLYTQDGSAGDKVTLLVGGKP